MNHNQSREDWERCASILAQHSDEMVQRWKSEIDMLLVFVSHLLRLEDRSKLRGPRLVYFPPF